MGPTICRLAPLLYLLSGAAGLVLEVTWFRQLALQLGHTTGATSTVLAAFMGGLAAGSWIGGRVGRDRSPAWSLRVFALAECGVALSALAWPAVWGLADPALVLAYADGRGGVSFALVRMAVAAVALLLPTLAMGAGFPLLARAVGAVSPDQARGQVAGRLYTANTVGASAGAWLAGFLLLPAIGTRWTTWTAAAIDLGVAGCAAWLSTRVPGEAAPAVADRKARADAAARLVPDSSAFATLALVTTALLGAVSLGSQVVWTRVLALLVGPTTYAFSAVLGVVIAGVAIGAAVGTRAGRHRPAQHLALAVLAVAATTLAAVALVDTLVLRVAAAATTPSVSFAALLWRQALVAIVLIGPTSVAFGAAFPLALAAAGATRDPGRVAALYTANTLGGIAGALLAGFVLVPRLGLQPSALAAAATAAAWGSYLAVLAVPMPRARAAAAALVLVTVLLVPWARWNPTWLASGPYRFASGDRRQDLATGLDAGEVLFLEEGAAATVVVRRLAGTTSLVIDGKPDASDAGDMLTQKLLGHVPLLVHDRPRRVCVIGLGSGVTTAAVLRHPVEAVDVVEISAEVVAASAHFRPQHGGVLEDARTRLLVTDARTHLRLARTTYDVIISEPSNPWMAGVASLFTTEFMRSVRARLAPGGVFCQWAHTYDMSEADLRSILATVRGVFPHASVWLVGEADLLIVAGLDAAPDPARLHAHWARPGVAADLQAVAVGAPRDVADLWVGGPQVVARLGRGATLQSDDRLALEFSAPRSFATRVGGENVALVLAAAPAAAAGRTAAEWASRGAMLSRAEAWPLAFDALAAAVRAGRDDEHTLLGFTRAAGAAGRVSQAVRLLRERVRLGSGGDGRLRAALASLLVATGDVRGGLDVLAEARVRDASILRAAAGIFADLGEGDTLRGIVGDLGVMAPGHPDTAYYAGTSALLDGDPARAAALAAAALARFPADARLHNLRGVALASQGRRNEARQAFATSRRLDPRQVGTYVNSARLEEEEGAPARAARLYAEALSIDAGSDAARVGLSNVRTLGK